MLTLARRLTIVALCLVLPAAATAQGNGTATRIAPGTYRVVPDSNFSAGMDVSAFTMRFEGDSVMVIEQAGAMVTRSRTSYEGEHLVWTDLEGALACPGVAKYKLAIANDGKRVRLTPVEDGCPERSAIVAQISLVRIE